MRRSLVTLTLGVLLSGVPVLASAQSATLGLAGAFAAADLATSDLAPAIATANTEEAKPVFVAPKPSSRSSLTALSVASAALQGLDAYTTLTALSRGANEANPVMQGAVRNPAMFVALKSGMTSATIFAAQRLWARNKPAAIALLAVSNGVMATVVAHNMSVLQQMR